MSWTAAEAKAEQQRGLVTLGQLGALGVSAYAVKWAVRARRLARVVQGVYRFAIVPASWEQRALAALLFAGEGAALSHATAASLWRLHGFKREDEDLIHLSLPNRSTAQLPRGFVVHRPRRAFIPYRLDGFSVTRLARTIVDVAPSLEEEPLEILLDAAQHRHASNERWLRAEVKGLVPKHCPGLTQLLALLDARKGVATESPLETRVRRGLRARGVPGVQCQYEVSDGRGVIMRVDFAWPRHRVALHVDGFLWHADRKTFDGDAAKRARLAAIGWSSMTVTSTSLRSVEWIAQLEALLDRCDPQGKLFGPGGGLGR